MGAMPRRLHIYLIDDNRSDLELAREAFSEHAGEVDLTTCSGAADALACLRDPRQPLPDVIVTDLNMPITSGLEFLKVLKADPALRLIPVVLLSTSQDAGDVHDAYTFHASSYLVKSPSFVEFMALVDTFVAFWQDARLPGRGPDTTDGAGTDTPHPDTAP